MRVGQLAPIASVLLAVEGLTLLALAVMQVVSVMSGEASSPVSGVALIILTVIGAAALFAFSSGVRRGYSWARSGGVVVHVVAIALALASLTIQPIAWAFILWVGVAGVLGFVLLVGATRQQARIDRAHQQGDSAADTALR